MITRYQILVVGLTVIAAFGFAGCDDSEPAPPAKPAPPAVTADQIQAEQEEAERLKRQEEREAEEKERRIERNRDAIDLMFKGMTLQEANDTLGVPGVKGLAIGGDGKQAENYEWKLEGGITIRATFVDGKLTDKEMEE